MGRTRILFGAATFLFAHYVIAYALPIASTDQSSLFALMSSISFGSSYNLEKNWTAESSVCSWMGVLCSSRNNRVINLDLSYMGLNGSIPPDLGNLSFLSSLDMKYNFFHGNFPESLAQLRRLKYLDLTSNNFSGPIPPSVFSSLSNLQFLYLSRNGFSGSIPSSVSNMSKLKELVLESNVLEGSIPGEIGDLRFLTVLDLQLNQLNGPIPPSIFNLSLMERLAFSRNNLSGNLPADICHKLPMLKGLYISKNRFDGSIPTSLGKCSQLETLSLSYNAFTGIIPREIGNLTQLAYLNLGDNNLAVIYFDITMNASVMARSYIVNFSGSIPNEIGNLRRLEVFAVFVNQLSGSISESIFNISTLRTIQCGINHLSGNLPIDLGRGIPNVRELNFIHNNLSGNMPDSLLNASELTYLWLSFNSFTGYIPETLGNLRSLKALGLAVNNLKSTSSSSELSIITSLTNCRNLTKLLIGWNPLSGVLPASVGNFSTNLEIFDLSRSEISGDIPAEMGNLSSVLRLNLFGNDLTGFIPGTVEGLLSIQELYLSNNRIKGSIPDTVCNLGNLGLLDLTLNQISGLVPSCIGNNTSLRYLSIGSNNFSSSLPPSLWTLKDLLEFNVYSNSLTGYLPPEIGNLRAIVNMDLSMNSFKGKIPTYVGRLQNLIYLSLANNKLEGPIPDSVGQMLSLETLDLSHNQITGGIPQSLAGLVYLKLFNVSFNRLSGQVPTEGPFQNFTGSSFMSNAALCGAAQFELLPCPVIHSNRRSHLIVCIFLGIFTFLLVSAFSAFLLMRCRMKKKAAVQNIISPEIKHESISYQELEKITNGFSEGNLIAAGSYSSVYKGVHKDGTHSAVKVFNFKFGRALETFDTEYQMLSSLRHRNLPDVITSSVTWGLNFRALVLEYMPNGSLEKWLYSHNYCLGILQRLDIMIDAASALDYLHNDYYIPVVHCDVKPSNVLLDEDMVGHLCDFGIAKLLGVADGSAHTKTIGTMGYIAPEYGTEGIVSTKCDVYSFGIMLMETFSRRKPSDDIFTGDITLRSWIKNSFPYAITQVADCNLAKQEETNFEARLQCVSSVMELALHCTAASPNARMNIHDVLSVLKKLRSRLILRTPSEKESDIQGSFFLKIENCRDFWRQSKHWQSCTEGHQPHV